MDDFSPTFPDIDNANYAELLTRQAPIVGLNYAMLPSDGKQNVDSTITLVDNSITFIWQIVEPKLNQAWQRFLVFNALQYARMLIGQYIVKNEVSNNG